jgi:hypothetical protein
MPSTAALTRPKLSARARLGLVAVGLGLLTLSLLYGLWRARVPGPVTRPMSHSPDARSKPPADASSSPAAAGPSHALDFAPAGAWARTTRPRRDIFSFVVPAPMPTVPVQPDRIEPSHSAATDDSGQIAAPVFRYAGRIGKAAVLVSASHHWLVQEGDLFDSARWQALQIRTDAVVVLEVSSGHMQVLPFPPKQ